MRNEHEMEDALKPKSVPLQRDHYNPRCRIYGKAFNNCGTKESLLGSEDHSSSEVKKNDKIP